MPAAARVCLYLRKSTEEHQADSLETQEAGARAYCEARGWLVVRVIADSGFSRSEFQKRPGLLELLERASSREFDVVVCRDHYRLAGDTFRGGLAIEALHDSGCRLFYYFNDREVRADDETWKVTTALDGWRSETERRAIAGRTREALQRKAAAGHNAGGRCFGYRNVRVFENEDGSGRKLRTEYAIDEREADVVRRIFTLYAGGDGYRAIAKLLNDEGVPSPRAGRRGTGTWDSSSVRAILFNERYFGRLVWGRRGSEYRGGTRVDVQRPSSTWVAPELPALRIVSEELQRAVEDRRVSSVKLYGRTSLRGSKPKYLLGGLARCGQCGGPIAVFNSRRSGEPVKAYGCKYNRTRGSKACAERTLRPMAAIDDALISWIQREVLSESFVELVIDEVRQRLEEEAAAMAVDDAPLKAEAAKLRADVARLVAALGKLEPDDQPEEVIELIAARKRQLRTLEARIAATAIAPDAIARCLDGIEAKTRARLGNLRELLGAENGRGRDALAALLDGPLQLHALDTVDGKRFELVGRYVLGDLAISEDAAATTSKGVPSGI